MVERLRPKRRIMRKLRIDELSSVDRPAQAHARMTLMKRDVSEDERERLAEGGKALPDGSYPIATRADLANAVQAFGRAKNKARTKRHIIARAKALDALDALPDSWEVSKSEDGELIKVQARDPAVGKHGEGPNSPEHSGGRGGKSGPKDRKGNVLAVGDEVESSQAGTWTGGKQIPHDKMVITGLGDEKHGQPIVDLDVHYGTAAQRDYHMKPVETHWAYADEVTRVRGARKTVEKKYKSVDELPDSVRNSLPEAAQRQFMAVVNSAEASGASEESAFKQAWGAIKTAGWHKDEDGKWVKKSDDVDVDASGDDNNYNDEGDEAMTAAEKQQLAELQKTVDALTKKLEAATAEDPAKKAADLAGELETAQAQLAEATEKVKAAETTAADAVAKAGMSDEEKSYMDKMSDEDKKEWLGMSPEDRKKKMKKAVDDDPVVYKAADGTEFRKSVGDHVIALAKRADESDKRASEETRKREDTEYAKRADDELKPFAESVAKREDKIEVLRAIDKMADGPKAAILKMLEVGGKAIGAAFETIGHRTETVVKSSQAFEKRVAEIAARDKLPRHEAMSKARTEFPEEFDAYQEASAATN